MLHWVDFVLHLVAAAWHIGACMDPDWLLYPNYFTASMGDGREWSSLQWGRRVRGQRCKGNQTALMPQLLFERCSKVLYVALI